MNLLLKAIKDKISNTGNLSTIVGRVFVGIVGDKTKLSDGPYVRVSVPGNQTNFGFNDNSGTDQTQIQFSTFGSTLNAADAITDKLITAFHNVALTMDSGIKAYGLRKNRGVLSEPKTPDSDQAFHSYVVIEFTYDGG